MKNRTSLYDCVFPLYGIKIGPGSSIDELNNCKEYLFSKVCKNKQEEEAYLFFMQNRGKFLFNTDPDREDECFRGVEFSFCIPQKFRDLGFSLKMSYNQWVKKMEKYGYYEISNNFTLPGLTIYNHGYNVHFSQEEGFYYFSHFYNRYEGLSIWVQFYTFEFSEDKLNTAVKVYFIYEEGYKGNFEFASDEEYLSEEDKIYLNEEQPYILRKKNSRNFPVIDVTLFDLNVAELGYSKDFFSKCNGREVISGQLSATYEKNLGFKALSFINEDYLEYIFVTIEPGLYKECPKLEKFLNQQIGNMNLSPGQSILMNATLSKININPKAFRGIGTARLSIDLLSVRKWPNGYKIFIREKNNVREQQVKVFENDIETKVNPSLSEETKIETNDHLTVSSSIEKLSNLIGLNSVKHDVNGLANLVRMQKLRESRGMKTTPISYHCVFTGNPGTGKTTVARLLAEIYKELGVISKGHLIETDRTGLVAEYVGQTGPKTNAIIDSALGGVLFIDEAYSLVQGNGNDFGQEAISTLLKRMEDDRDKLIVILAGYSKEMDAFIKSNSGLQSRFNRFIHFDDYTIDELIEIFKLRLNEEEYICNEDTLIKVREVITYAFEHKDEKFGNGRYVRNLFERALMQQALRLSDLDEHDISDDDMKTIRIQDIANF